MTCWTRPRNSELGCSAEEEDRLHSELRFSMAQLDKRAMFCDQLAAELRHMQYDLEIRCTMTREVRGLLGSTNAELRAAARASAMERVEHEEEVVDLRQEIMSLQRKAAAARGTPGSQYSRLVAVPVASGEGLAARPAELEEAAAKQTARIACLREEFQACQDQCIWLQEQRSLAAADAALAARADAATELSSLREECVRDRKLAEESASQLRALRSHRTAEEPGEVQELRVDMVSMGSGLEEKEQDILSIQFEMVELKNRLRDQAHLVYQKTAAAQKASQELAAKDGKLQAMRSQMNELQDRLQRKVLELTQELEGSHVAHEFEKRALLAELEQVRSGASSAEELKAFKQELRAVRRQAEHDARELEVRLRSEQLVAARALTEAGFREARLLEELQAERSRHGLLLRQLRHSARTGSWTVSDAQAEADAAAGSWGALEGVHAESTVEMLIAKAAGEDSQHTQELQEQLAVTKERLAVAESQLMDVATALQQSRLLESQARETAQEYFSSTLERHRAVCKGGC